MASVTQVDLDVISGDTEIGGYFVSNYPPFSAWSAGHVPRVEEALDTPIDDPQGAPVGLYIHIPFCRKRCRFCYYRVYTDKNAREVEDYLHALEQEVTLYADRRSLSDRSFEFVYFGGGTPSFLSSEQLKRLVGGIARHWSWDRAREVTFECEPGTLKKGKLETIRAIGVTRLSLGVEHFDDEILSTNGRAHQSAEIFRAYDWAREVGFDQINFDLIAGMIGDTESAWKETVDKTLSLAPDSITIYQMELPSNSVAAREVRESHGSAPVVDWATKRAWVDHAFARFEEAGYVVSSGYTLVKPPRLGEFVYRDSVWQGSDMIGMGVASFSYVQGLHYQNVSHWADYLSRLSAGELPVARALPITDRQRLIREVVLQLKLGRLDAAYFRSKFGMEISDEFAEAWDLLGEQGLARWGGDEVLLTRAGLLRVDALLPRFFEPVYRNSC